MALPVLVINRAQDTRRLARFADSARAVGTTFERIEAVDGHAPGALAPFADLIGDAFWGEPHAKPGAIGCFLSHRRAWQAVVDRGLPHALICEDDAVLYRTPSGLESHLNDSARPEILFVNQRLGDWARAVSSQGVVPIPEVITNLAALGGPKAKGLKAAPGGDGYVLGPPGARHLLSLTASQKILCGVDWAMVWNSLPDVSGNIASAFPELGILRDVMPGPDGPLSAQVLTDPILDQSGEGGSTIKHRITLPITDLTSPPSADGQ